MQSNILSISCTALHLSNPPERPGPIRSTEEQKGPASPKPGPDLPKSG
jgi:hypothetical protein